MSSIFFPKINDLVFWGAKENSNNLWRIPITAQVFSVSLYWVWDLDDEMRGNAVVLNTTSQISFTALKQGLSAVWTFGAPNKQRIGGF